VAIEYSVAGSDVQIAISASRDGAESRVIASATARLLTEEDAAR
jgi:hypothetical protein